MDAVMQTIPISTLRQGQGEVLKALKDDPIVLTHQGVAAAVMLTPTLWNSVVHRLKSYEALMEARQRLHEMETDSDSWTSMEEFEQGYLAYRSSIDDE